MSSLEYCHWIVPLEPFNVNVLVLEPAQTDPAPLIVPATAAEVTVAVTAVLGVFVQLSVEAST